MGCGPAGRQSRRDNGDNAAGAPKASRHGATQERALRYEVAGLGRRQGVSGHAASLASKPACFQRDMDQARCSKSTWDAEPRSAAACSERLTRKRRAEDRGEVPPPAPSVAYDSARARARIACQAWHRVAIRPWPASRAFLPLRQTACRGGGEGGHAHSVLPSRELAAPCRA